jgi:glycosyltransferase involved in cell wall biosynthesis
MDFPVGKISSSRIIIVLGMHRSGTSSITRGLMALGVPLGDDLYPAGIDNPKGFWEDKDCLGINEELLTLLGSSYDQLDLGFEINGSDSRIQELRVRASEILQKKLMQGGGLWGFKDPRTCRLLRFWLPLFHAAAKDLASVLCLRNPMSVARSLQKRDGISFEKSYILWLQHMLPPLSEMADHPTVVVEYDRMIANPRVELLRIAESLSLDLTNLDSELSLYAEEFIEESLQNNKFSELDLRLDQRAPAAVMSLYMALSKVASDQTTLSSAEVKSAIQEAYSFLTAVRPTISYVNHLESGLRNAVSSATEHRKVSEELLNTQERVTELEIALKNEMLDRSAGESSRMMIREELVIAHERVAELTEDVSALTEILGDARKNITSLESTLESELASRDAHYEVVQSEFQRSKARVLDLDSALLGERDRADKAISQAHVASAKQAAAMARLMQIEASTTWRSTALLRHALTRRPRAARLIRRTLKVARLITTRQFRARLRVLRYAKTNIPPSNVSTILVDWLAAIHNQSQLDRVPVLSSDAMLGYYREIGIAGDQASILTSALSVGFDATTMRRLHEIVTAIIQSNSSFTKIAREIETSPLFDAQDYAVRVGLMIGWHEAAIHYLLFGELLGFSPSSRFDPKYYMLTNEDLCRYGCSALIHYMRHGSGEGRRALPRRAPAVTRGLAEQKQSENIIVVVHEMSRTGAPILGLNIASRLSSMYNVFVVTIGDGVLAREFSAVSQEVYGPFIDGPLTDIDVEYGLRRLFEKQKFKYAIVNSMGSSITLQACASAGVPIVLLVHEFASTVFSDKTLIKAYRTANEIVFPAAIVEKSSLSHDKDLSSRTYHIIPQGMSEIPSTGETSIASEATALKRLATLRTDGSMVVLGAGSVQMRKGVDLFLEVAACVQRRTPKRPVHFVWVGDGYNPQEDPVYSLYLKEQLERSGLSDHFTFMDAMANLESVYAITDTFMLASRLDPLPNVGIDATMRGIPTICFHDASGIAEILLENPETAELVVPHLDCAAAADIIVRLACDETHRLRLASATKEYAYKIFDMDRYVREIDRLGRQAEVAVTKKSPRSIHSLWFDGAWYKAQYGVSRDHIDYLIEGVAAGHAPSQFAAQVLDKVAPGTQFSPALYDAFMKAADFERPISSEALRLLVALYVPAWHKKTGIEGFLDYLREGVDADKKPGPLFDSDLYQKRAAAANLLPQELGESSIMHWLRHGVPARIVPTERFNDEFYLANNADLRGAQVWGFAHYIEHGFHEGRVPNARNIILHRPPSAPWDPLPKAYESWHVEDFGGSEDFFGITTADEDRLVDMLNSTWLENAFKSLQEIEPEIGHTRDITAHLMPPHHSAMTALHHALRARMPSMRYNNVICVPWIRTGGADLVAGLLAGALLRIRPDERVLILRTDNPHFERADWIPSAADCVDMSDIRAGLTEDEAQTLLRVLFRGVNARRVFNVNSRLCWTVMRDNKANMAATHANYAYLFCWDQTPSGQRVGYPAEFFAETAAHMTAFLTDTEYLKTELTSQYRLSSGIKEKILPLGTPAQSRLRSKAVARELAESGSPLPSCVLWAGRLDRQKRFELVQEIASLMPDTIFRCWGAALLDTPPDLTKLPSNMVMEGSFESFDDLPLTQAGAWLFTSSWEGMPTTIIELAMRGVAVVASAVGGVPELIMDDTGWPIPPEAGAKDYVAALRAVFADPAGTADRAEALQNLAAARHVTDAYDTAIARLLDQETPL